MRQIERRRTLALSALLAIPGLWLAALLAWGTLLANLPTVAEQGLPGFDTTSWVGMVAPVRTPPAVTAKLVVEIEKVTRSPDVVARIEELGSVPGTAFGKDFAKFMAAETAKWAAVIKASGARAD